MVQGFSPFKAEIAGSNPLRSSMEKLKYIIVYQYDDIAAFKYAGDRDAYLEYLRENHSDCEFSTLERD